MAAPIAYRDSQARGRTGVTAAGLYHSHSNSHSESQAVSVNYTSLRAIQILNPLSELRDRNSILMDTSWICFSGTPLKKF